MRAAFGAFKIRDSRHAESLAGVWIALVPHRPPTKKRRNIPSGAFANQTRCSSVALGCCGPSNVLRCHIKSKHEPVCALELKRLRTFMISLKLIRHHDEAVIAWRSPVPDILEHGWFIG